MIKYRNTGATFNCQYRP